MRIYCLLLMMLSTNFVFSQRLPVKLNFGAGVAFLGTGDITGSTFFTEAEIPFRKISRLTLSPGLQFTNHSETIYFNVDSELRNVVSGITAWLKIDYALLLRQRHRVTIGAGPSLRFQSNTQPSGIDVRYGPNGPTNIEFIYHEPLNRLSPGYLIAPQYQFMATRRLSVGIRPMLQNDTNGDVLSSMTLLLGVSL